MSRNWLSITKQGDSSHEETFTLRQQGQNIPLLLLKALLQGMLQQNYTPSNNFFMTLMLRTKEHRFFTIAAAKCVIIIINLKKSTADMQRNI